MNKSVKSTKNTKKTKAKTLENSFYIKLALAVYLLIFMILQLFTFERFPGLLSEIGFDHGVMAGVLAVVLVVVELLSLPYLVGLRTSAWVTKFSRVLVFVALTMLSVVEIVAFSSGQTAFMGDTLDLPGGAWSLLLIAALWLLAIWGVVSSRADLSKSYKS